MSDKDQYQVPEGILLYQPNWGLRHMQPSGARGWIKGSDLPAIKQQWEAEQGERLLGDEAVRRAAKLLFGVKAGEHLEAVRRAHQAAQEVGDES
jgi:hypothetical protein